MANITNEIRLEGFTLDSPFVPGSNVQFAWDSVSLTAILSCPRRYKYGIIEGWTPKTPDVALALIFGILLHAGVEEYHRQRTAGVDHEPAVENTLWHLYTRPEFDQLPIAEDISAAKEEQDEDDNGIALRNAKVRTRYHLFRALVWYFERYKDDPLKVVQLDNDNPAVEFSFRAPTGKELSDGTELMLSGHFDRLVEFNDHIYPVDVKTTKAISKQWKADFDLSHQMTGYTFGGKITLERPTRGVWIDAIALQQWGVKFDRFLTERSPNQITEFLSLIDFVGEMAERYYQADFYPMNTAACMFCEYKQVCKQDPALRQGYLHAYFERKPPWNPLANR